MNSKAKPAQPVVECQESSLLHCIDDLVSVVDRHYYYRAVSQGYTKFFGCEVSDIVGKHVAEIHGQENFEQQIKPGLDRTLAGEDTQIQFWRPDHTGELRFLDSKHTPYTGPLTDGKGIMVIARDVTELIQTQDSLKKERYLLTTIINAIPDMIFVKDLKGAYQLCNRSFETFLGTTSEQILGKTDFELMSEESANYISIKDKQVKTSQQALRCDEWVSYNDGRKRLMDMYKLPLHDKDHALSGLLGIGRNVTYERETEQQLLMAALLFETTPDPCLIIGQDGQVKSSNSAAKTKFIALQHPHPLYLTDLFYSPGKTPIQIENMLSADESWQGELYTTDHKPFLATINAVNDSAGTLTQYVLMIRNEHSHQQFAEELRSKAYHDPLTGLPNRLLFQSRLESAIIRSERQHQKVAVLFIDLNNFKPVNDQYGHLIGDRVLREVALQIKRSFRASDTIARLGGDEFVALIDIQHRESAGTVAEKVIQSLSSPLLLDVGVEVSIGASIGISIFPDDAGSANELLRKADDAMYSAKRSAKCNYAFSSPPLT